MTQLEAEVEGNFQELTLRGLSPKLWPIKGRFSLQPQPSPELLNKKKVPGNKIINLPLLLRYYIMSEIQNKINIKKGTSRESQRGIPFGTFSLHKKLDKILGIYYNMPMKKTRTDIKSEKFKKITRILLEQKGYARTTELQKKGIHQRDINMLLSDGALIKIKNGLYRYADTPVISHQGFIDISQAVPGGVICLLSALSFYELTTFNPTVISVAIHRKNWKPRIEYPPVEFFFFSREQYEAGIDEFKIGGFRVPIYCPEKTICDSFRYRNKLGLDTAKESLTLYLKRKDRNIEKLLKYAAICRVKPLIETWLHAMT